MNFDIGVNTEFEAINLFVPFATRLPEWKGSAEDFLRKFDLKLYQPRDGKSVRFFTSGCLRINKRSLKKVMEFNNVVILPTSFSTMLLVIINKTLKKIELAKNNICLINIKQNTK